MTFIYGLAIGIVIGFIGGALVWRRNGARVEAAASAVANDVKKA